MTAVLDAQGLVPRRSVRLHGGRTAARKHPVAAGPLAFFAPAFSPPVRRPLGERPGKAARSAPASPPLPIPPAGAGGTRSGVPSRIAAQARQCAPGSAERARRQLPLRLTARGRVVILLLWAALAVGGAAGRMVEAPQLAGVTVPVGTAANGTGAGATAAGGPVAGATGAGGTAAGGTAARGTVAGGLAPGIPLGVVSSAVGARGASGLR